MLASSRSSSDSGKRSDNHRAYRTNWRFQCGPQTFRARRAGAFLAPVPEFGFRSWTQESIVRPYKQRLSWRSVGNLPNLRSLSAACSCRSCQKGMQDTEGPTCRSTVAARASESSAIAARGGINWHYLALTGRNSGWAGQATRDRHKALTCWWIERKGKARRRLPSGLCCKRAMRFEPTTFTLATCETVAASVCVYNGYDAYYSVGDQLSDGIPGTIVHHWPPLVMTEGGKLEG